MRIRCLLDAHEFRYIEMDGTLLKKCKYCGIEPKILCRYEGKHGLVYWE